MKLGNGGAHRARRPLVFFSLLTTCLSKHLAVAEVSHEPPAKGIGTVRIKEDRAPSLQIGGDPYTINVGENYTFTIELTCDAGSDYVVISVSGYPTTGGASISINPNPVSVPGTSVVTFITTTATNADIYPIYQPVQGELCTYPPLSFNLTVLPIISLLRQDIITVVATGFPAPPTSSAGGAFSYEVKQIDPEYGINIISDIFATGNNAASNPNTTILTAPDNPTSSGVPTPGGLPKVQVNYTFDQLVANNDTNNPFEAAAFGMSCYYTTLQSDWGTAPSGCSSFKYKGNEYSGSVTNPPNLTGLIATRLSSK